MVIRSAFCLGLVSVLIGSCGGDGGAPAERLRNGVARLDESAIHASIVPEGVELLVSVERLRLEGSLEGRLKIDLVDVSQGAPVTVASGQVRLSQSAATETHRILLSGAGQDLERTEAGPLVLDWRLDLSHDDLYGHRSLYAALGNLEVQLRGPTELPAEGSSPLHVVVRDPRTSRAVEDASVRAVLVVAASEDAPATETTLFEGTTDARGELARSLSLPAGVEAASMRVTVAHEGAQVWTTRPVSRRADDQLYLGTEKTIYKPGQDIHFRLLALEGADRRPVADREVVFEAKDGRGNKVFRRRGRTDAFGVAATTVPTDERVNEGSWTLAAEVEGRRTELVVPVERYQLPKMRVLVTSERGFALPGETLVGRVNAAYLFGEPVTNAAVTLSARTAAGVALESFSGQTDAEGGMDFQIAVPESLRSEALEESGDTVILSAQVIDAAAQTEQGEGAVALAAAPLRINLVADGIRAGAPAPVYVIVTDPLGRPLRASVEVSGIEVPATETTASGIAALQVTPASGSTAIEVTASDGAGRTHARGFTLEAAVDTGLRVRSDKAVYRAGDHATLEIDAEDGIERVTVDAYQGATGVLSTTLDLEGGHAEIDLPIADELGGLVVIDAFALRETGESLRASRPILIEREDALQITIAPDRETYGPGEEARLDVTVVDPSGAPQVASVGLAVVDEAVFALGGEPTTSLRGSFGLDERVLPQSLQVAGRGASDLYNVEDPADREQLARLLFAGAGDVAAPNFDYNSLAEELPRVRDSLTQKLVFDAQTELEMFDDVFWLTVDTVRRRIQDDIWIDPFGRPYRLVVNGTDQWSLSLDITTDGPDETPDTADDATATTSLSGLFHDGRATGGDGAEAMDFEEAGDFAVDGDADQDEPAPPSEDGQAKSTTVRTDFRETAYVNPVLITDASGRASVTVPLAHSITTWRASADGSTSAGRIGSARQSFRTFQDFFVDFSLPTRLTRGDVIEVPAVVYNYLGAPTQVTVSLDPSDQVELQSSSTQMVDLGPSEVRAVRFRIRILQAGALALGMHATAGAVSDALVRTASVAPDGQPEDETASGQIADVRTHTLHLPADTVEGGASVELALTTGFASEVVQGVESLLQEPSGCFEQTTSTAWPNTLVARYLDETGQMTAEKREEVVALVTRGYQRLLTFESPTGGFNWWGDGEPGNRILSAIMLWHLQDLESLIEIDTSVRDRTLQWLLAQQNADGSWEPGDALHAGNEVLGTSRERTTAFIDWALAHTGWADDAVDRAAAWLGAHPPPDSDLYASALAANALALVDPRGAAAVSLFERLDRGKVDRGEGGLLWPTDAPTWTGTGGDTASIETTGLVAYGLIQAGAFPDDAAGAMRFILANKDAVGTWYNTQATMNALRALSAGLSGGGSDAEGTLEVTVNGVLAHEIDVNQDNRDLLRRFDLTDLVSTGANEVALQFTGTGEVTYRLTRRAYRPVLPGAEGPLAMSLEYDTTVTEVGMPVTATVQATNNDEGTRDQVIVQVGRAPGFVPALEDLELLVQAGIVSRYEVRADDVTFYLMGMAAGETRSLGFRLTPGLVVEATAPASSIYAYYEPNLRQELGAETFVVTAE